MNRIENPARKHQPRGPFGTKPWQVDKSREIFHPPRLGIIHLLGWTAISAVLMKVAKWSGQFEWLPEHVSGWIRISFATNRYTLMAVISAGIVGMYVLSRSRHRDRSARLQAGHWMVVNMTVSSILSMIIFTIFFVTGRWLDALPDPSWIEPLMPLLIAGSAIPEFLLSTLWIVAAIRMREIFAWKAMFGFFAISAVVSGLYYISIFYEINTSLVSSFTIVLRITAMLTLVFLSTVVSMDLRRRTRRDWLHWLGVVTVFITSILTIAHTIVYEYATAEIQ